MEITPQTFIDMENNISENRLLIRKIIAATNFGIIPRTKFLINHEIVNGTLILKQVDCDLLMPTGQVVVIETNANTGLGVPPKDVNELYLTVEVGENVVPFVRDGIQHLANEYKFDIKTLAEIRNAVPLLKLMLVNGAWTVYEPYIMPVMTARSSVALLEKLDELKQEVQKVINHEHAELLEDRVLVMILLEQLNSFSVDESSRELVLLCKRIATALSYSVYKRKAELPAPNIMDIEPYLNAFKVFMSDIAVAMNDLKPMVVEVKEKEPEPVEDVFCPII
jgi:hypothetical protein